MAKKLKPERSVRDHYPKRHGDSASLVVHDPNECTRQGKKCHKRGKKSTCARTGHLCEV